MTIKKTAGRTAYVKPGDTTPFLDHMAVWSADTEASAKFLTECLGWKRHPTIIRVSDDDPTVRGMIGTFFDSPGVWIELIEPTTPGPGQDILDQMGDGALVEINFDLGDEYEKALGELADRGVNMLAMDGSPIVDGGRIDEGVMKDDGSFEGEGELIAYFPPELSQGTTVEYYEVISGRSESLLYERDQVWKNEIREPDTPYVDHIGILVEDIEKTAEFYKNYMGLEHNPLIAETEEYGGSKISFVNANGYDEKPLWLKLVQPLGKGRAKDLMEKFDKGHIFEIGAEVSDVRNFAAQMKDKNINMVQFDDSAISSDDNIFVTSVGDKECHFPLSISCGIPIKIFERADDGTGLYDARDKA